MRVHIVQGKVYCKYSIIFCMLSDSTIFIKNLKILFTSTYSNKYKKYTHRNVLYILMYSHTKCVTL